VRAAIIVAGGSGERFGRAGGKQLAPVLGRPMLSWSVQAMAASSVVDAIVVVADPDRLSEFAAVAGTHAAAVVAGGPTRQDSVAAGLAALPEGVTTVAIHDGARPLVTAETIRRAFEALESHPGIVGVVVGRPLVDTPKRVLGPGSDLIEDTPPRETLWAAETPQVFRAPELLQAYERASREGFRATDDAGVVEHAGGLVMLLSAEGSNIKVTAPEDLAIAECVLARRLQEGRSDG
jgi:2-C-methyl-D-erythritol 4-phosphate cytidylyltransferase